ncbi:MAG: DDE-type integrase/transposase/recombinase [Gammaproteobacteria bacterium]|nr:DDE-type integrase/transposase/recombinase [Gammaproteobacteria bacterium]
MYYANGLKYNLMSVPTMTQLGAEVTFGHNEASIAKNDNRIYLRRVDGLWALPEEEIRLGIASLRMERSGTTNAETWHRRLAHPSDNKLTHMIESKVIPRDAARFTAVTCRTCRLTYPSRRPMPHTAERSGKVTVQVDYMPMGQMEKGWKGEVGAYVFSSRSSKLLKAYPVKNASTLDAVDSLEKYCKFVLPFLGEKVDCIQTDAGNQFTSQEWREVCAKRGLTCRTCPVDHQAMNRQVERAIGILAAKMRALLLGMNMHNKYWPLAIETVIYILNRTPHTSLQNIPPLEKSTGDKPDLKRCRVFGCKAYVQVPKTQRRGKLSRTAWEGVMVGYSTSSPEWIILDPRSGKLRTAHSVTFDELTPGLEPENLDNRRLGRTMGERHLVPTAGSEPEAPHEPEERGDSSSSDTYPEAVQGLDNPGTSGNTYNEREGHEGRDNDYNDGTDEEPVSEGAPSPESPHSSELSYRTPEESEWEGSEDEDPTLGVGMYMALALKGDDVPRSWKQAVEIPYWLEAMERERDELEALGAWESVPRPPGAKVLPGLWRFKVKHDDKGEITRYKARWCVDGSWGGVPMVA